MTVGKTQRNIFILLGTGATAGLLGGLLGVGGGILLVPIFVFLFGFDQHRAHGTSLAVIVCLSFVGMLGYSGHGLIDWRIAFCVVIGSVIGAILGGKLIALIKSRLLRYMFCGVLGLVGVRMIFYGCGIDLLSANLGHTIQGALQKDVAYLAIGLITGLWSALLGVGGGLIVVPALVIFMGIGQHEAQGISLAVMFPTAITGTLMHLRLGNVDLRVGKWAGLGAAGGALVGLVLANTMKSNTLQLTFGIFVCIMALLLVFRKEKTAIAKSDIGESNE